MNQNQKTNQTKNLKQALLISIVSNRYTVFHEGEMIVATAMGKLRLGEKPLVGDRVMIQEIDGKWHMQKVLERENQLTRPAVANVDQTLLVMSVLEPDFSYTLVDRLIFLIASAGIEPVIVISKADLASEAFLAEILEEYKTYQVIVCGMNLPTEPLEAILADKLSVLAGQSGVGKSSILNRINPDFKLNTQGISKALGRGKHTTRHNELYRVADGWIADTPGFSSLDFSSFDRKEFAKNVPDFKPYFGACRYRDCLHDKEPSCKIKEEVEKGGVSKRRYQHYLDCLDLIKEES